jgi:hypothetical protein
MPASGLLRTKCVLRPEENMAVTPTSTSVLRDLTDCPDPLYRALPIRFRKPFAPLGQIVQVESNEAAVIEAANQSFGRYGEPATAGPPAMVIQLFVDPDAHDHGPWPVPVYRARQHLFHIACNLSFAIADLRTGSAVGFISREMLRDRSFFRNTFLECLFHVLAVHQSLTPVHCAAVAVKHRGALICGISGAGKTTLAYACAKAGMQIVSDDVVHLEWSSRLQQLILWGNPWQLRLLPEACELFPELSDKPPQLRSDHEWYLEVDVAREFPQQAQERCEPAALIFLERAPEVTLECRPMDPGLAFQSLKRDIVLDEDSIISRHYDVLSRLVQTGAYTLRYSGRPDSAVASIRTLLSQDF